MSTKTPEEPPAVFRQAVTETMRNYSQCRGVEHFAQVTRLALRLYDGLATRHRLPPRHRELLWAAAMLHDIGTATGPSLGHAGRSGRMILELQAQIPCDAGPMTLAEIATVAALHGIDATTPENPLGALDGSIAALWPAGTVPLELQMLAAMLRVADGLDRGLCQVVADLTVDAAQHRIVVTVKPDIDAAKEISKANEKSGLFRALFGNAWRIE